MIAFKLNELKKHLTKNEITDVQITAAAEYMVDNNFKRLLKEKRLLTFHHNYVLIELNYFNPPIDLYEILFELQISGYKPVLAHPERYGYFQRNSKEYEKLKKAGCLFQLNLLSLSNFYGKNIQQTATKLLKAQYYDLAGTDTHHQGHIDSLKKIKGKKIISLLKPLLQKNTILTL